ncbi:zinc finger protein 497-like [Pseudoliparis swirei]|uniref:zinc finger protein 497-like n=1 Tax=Pseudoliparis swirei TaxID=2059687 RepID=UPI0024BEE79A|nr:zinc finger protein 497-like [Pseudoliparis swirei]
MRHVSEKTAPPLPLSCLRLLVPPLRLLSAAIWETVQQKVVANYGLLDDFVTAVTEIVPGLLNPRQRRLLSLGLRAQLTLELCRPEQTIEMKTLQPHLDVITSLWNTEVSDSGAGPCAPSLLGLIHTLLKDQEERRHFFQDVFPVTFGDKYSEDIQMFVEIFLLRLEKLLPVPNHKQVACMLSDAPSVLSECLQSFCQPQELKSLLEYHKELSQLNDSDDQPVGASICSALRLPPLTAAATEREETPLEVNVLTDYMEAFNKELIVGAATPRKSQDGGKTSSGKPGRREPGGLEGQSLGNGVQHVGSLDIGKTSVDSHAVEVHVGNNVRVLAEGAVASENEPLVRPPDDLDYNVLSPSETEKSSKETSNATTDGQERNTNISTAVMSPAPDAAAAVTFPTPVRGDRRLKVRNVSAPPKDEPPERDPRVPPTGKTCPTCGKTYSRAADMRRHQRSHTGERPFRCSRCEKRFQFQHDLKRHEWSACRVARRTGSEVEARPERDARDTERGDVPGRLRTPPTDVGTRGEERRMNPKQVADPSGDGERDPQPEQSQEPRRGNRSGRKSRNNPADAALRCVECRRSFPDAARLKTHNLRHEPRACTKCGESFKGFVDLNQHYADVHDFRGPFPCTACDRSYTDLRGLTRHERLHTGDLPFTCPKCPKAFGYASALTLHDRTHTNEAPFLCWDCGKGCRSNGALRTHRLCRHGGAAEKRFCCEHCGQAYALKRSLDLHVAKLHAGVRYPCARCGKLFRSASSLTRHDRTHTAERPYSCARCGKSFRSASELKIHTRYHTGERPFKCRECGKGFVQSYYLTAHTRTHTGEKPYRCATCDKCFKSAGILKRHQRTHTGEKPHKCAACEMAFSRPELVKAHAKKCH